MEKTFVGITLTCVGLYLMWARVLAIDGNEVPHGVLGWNGMGGYLTRMQDP
jgi:hypothetical protein